MPEIITARIARVCLVFTRATKRTYRFDADRDGQPVTSLYVQQTAFPSGPPKAVIVTVEAE